MTPPILPPTAPDLHKALDVAIAMHGPEVVAGVTTMFAEPMYPLMAAILAAQALADKATAHGLTPADVDEALSFVAALKRADDPHGAWLAAEIITRLAGEAGAENLKASL